MRARLVVSAVIGGLLGGSCAFAFASGDVAYAFILLAALLLFWAYMVVADR